MPDGAIDKILEINVKSAVLLTREVAPHMPKVSAAFQQYAPRPVLKASQSVLSLV